MTAAAVTSDLMTEVVTFPGVSSRPSKAQRESARTRFPPRPVVTDWPTTHQERAEVWERLTSGMFVLDNANSQERRVRGLAWLLDWLADQPGETWQQRWMASGADAAGGAWRRVPIAWQQARGRESRWLWHELSGALVVAICGDLVRPSLRCLIAGAAGKGSLTRNLARIRDPQGFACLRALCAADPHVSADAESLTLRRSAEIIAAKGGVLADITVGDALELMDAKPRSSPARQRITRSSTGCCANSVSSKTKRRNGCGRSAPRASSPRPNSWTATSCTAARSATCSWTTWPNASPRWTTPA